ncbi:hypothetical protein FRACA_620003 [Frankia canadensis]|uniref:Uncharacterized protein n=1 Tax=Frankia canadensis TaxID=1836972 RepID=A0A2I2KZQ6_9ACTN|nr:hypothetical protein FRACA_620003 [Frankia canadensis]SOU58444.1 hypothetical protein FRACA_620003 [Frankia canadensis]
MRRLHTVRTPHRQLPPGGPRYTTHRRVSAGVAWRGWSVRITSAPDVSRPV